MKRRILFEPWKWMLAWLTSEDYAHEVPMCDFARLSQDLRPGDVLLIEGRTRIAGVIKLITQSPWTHSALYIGRLHDIQDRGLRRLVMHHYQQDYSEQLLVEAVIGEGARVSPLNRYRHEHLRICRPDGLSPADAQQVCGYAIRRLGSDYDVRQLLDLARFLLPWGILPRRWRSTLFATGAALSTRTVCSCLLAEAYASVDFPILPFVDRQEDGEMRMFKRNPRLFTPRDFDYSPYFDILKYPFLGIDAIGVYRELPWCRSEAVYSDRNRFYRVALTSALAHPTPEDEPGIPPVIPVATPVAVPEAAPAGWSWSRLFMPGLSRFGKKHGAPVTTLTDHASTEEV